MMRSYVIFLINQNFYLNALRSIIHFKFRLKQRYFANLRHYARDYGNLYFYNKIVS